MKGKTQRYYDENPAARKKKAKTDKAINARPEQVKKRVELNKANRKAQKNGSASVGDKKDFSHTKKGLVQKPQSVNRGSKKDSKGDRNARG